MARAREDKTEQLEPTTSSGMLASVCVCVCACVYVCARVCACVCAARGTCWAYASLPEEILAHETVQAYFETLDLDVHVSWSKGIACSALSFEIWR